MSDLIKILNNLQNKLNEKKVQKLTAEKELKEITEQLKNMNLDPDKLDEVIKEKTKEMSKLEEEIETKIKDIEIQLR